MFYFISFSRNHLGVGDHLRLGHVAFVEGVIGEGKGEEKGRVGVGKGVGEGRLRGLNNEWSQCMMLRGRGSYNFEF